MRTKRSGLRALAARKGELERAVERADAPRGFRAALAASEGVALIAECKRRSPGAGEIRPGLDAAALGRSYQDAGAAALSVLTDEEYFGGTAADLRAARGATSLPALRKDFTLDSLHVLEARAMGADAVLLIVRLLDDGALAALHREATGLGMDALVEVHDAAELERALRIGADLIGINNRDLATFRTDLATTTALLDVVPDGALAVSESGIHTAEDVARLAEAGIDAILVGESILRAPDPAGHARSLACVPKGRAGGARARARVRA